MVKIAFGSAGDSFSAMSIKAYLAEFIAYGEKYALLNALSIRAVKLTFQLTSMITMSFQIHFIIAKTN
jgi:hypothetical protein